MTSAKCKCWGGALAGLVAIALPASASAASPAGDTAGPSAGAAGSPAGEVSYWAHPTHRTIIRRHPSPGSRRVARIHYLTEDHYPEVYPVLRGFTDPEGRTWLRIRIPMRPNGRTGWVRDTSLGPLNTTRTRLVVDRGHLRATLFRDGRRIWRSRIGVGKARTRTPRGRFWIREKFRTRNPKGMYGPRAFGTGAYSRLSDWPGGGVIGIHGTNRPSLLPGRPSHGCVRLPNRAIKKLYRLMPVGTPVHIR